MTRSLRLAPLVRALFTAEGLRYAALLTGLTALAGGAGFASVEPKTTEGKAIAIAVMLVGIGFASLVVGAIAQRFISPAVHQVELTDEDLVAQVRDISTQLQRLEQTLEQRFSVGNRRDDPVSRPLGQTPAYLLSMQALTTV